MGFLVAACLLALAKTGIAHTRGHPGHPHDRDCSVSDRTMFFNVVTDGPRPGSSFSGAPMMLEVWGTASSKSAVMDVGDAVLSVEVRIVAPTLKRLGKTFHANFNLDICTDLVGVTCPMPVGAAFEGVASWNALKVPVDAGPGRVDQETTVSYWTQTGSKCKMGRKFNTLLIKSTNASPGAFVTPAINHRLSRVVNAVDGGSWKSEHSPRFDGYSVADARRIAGGTVMRGQHGFEELPRRRYIASPRMGPTDAAVAERRLLRKSKSKSEVLVDASYEIPDNFDTREAFPGCASVVGRIRDQSDCGSCWAFASTEAFNDRRCIALTAGNGGEATADMMQVLSAEDTTACCSGLFCGFSMGCNGGQPGSAWKWFARTGVVSGGDFSDVGTGKTCKPYEFQPCAHHVDPAASGYPSCPDGEYPTPKCMAQCSEDTYGNLYKEDKKKAKEAYSLGTIEDIQRDMMLHGSVTAAFSVYSDFLTYSGGVYNHVDGEYLGGHAVKIIGWGEDAASGKDYWLVVNSWNSSWGEDGLFRILRGVNECGIEGQIVAGEA